MYIEIVVLLGLSAGRLAIPLQSVARSGFPLAKSYLLTFPDRSKKHIRRAERDDLLLSGLAKQVGPDQYEYTGERRTLHGFAALATVNFHFGEPKKRYYPGAYIIELKDRRYHERLETPESLAFRITNAANLETETA